MEDTPKIRAALREKQEELNIRVDKCKISTSADGTTEMVLEVRMKCKIPFEDVIKFMDEHKEIRSLSV